MLARTGPLGPDKCRHRAPRCACGVSGLGFRSVSRTASNSLGTRYDNRYALPLPGKRVGALALSSRGYSRYRHSELEIWAVLSMLGCVTVHAEPKHEVGWVTPIHVEPAVGLVMCICFRTSAAEALRDPSSSYKYRMELD